MRGKLVSAAPHDLSPIQNYATRTGAPATDFASIGVAICVLLHLFTNRSAVPGNMIGQPERVYKHAERCTQS